MNERMMEILPPVGGINKRGTRQSQPPYTSVASTNFWPIHPVSKRLISAVRPPKVTTNLTQPSGATTVNLLVSSSGVTISATHDIIVQYMAVARNSELYWWNGSAWTIATGAEASRLDVTATLGSATFINKLIIGNPNATDTGGTGRPFVFDILSGQLTLMVASAGTIPVGLNMFAVWQGCLVAAGEGLTGVNDALGHVVYMSRTGDARDWDFSVGIQDEGGAFFSAGDNEGLLTGKINALIPFTDDILLVGTERGISVFNGHPRRGGIVTQIDSTYIRGPRAWCKGAKGELYFLGPEGLMAMEPSAHPVPVLLSAEKLPDEIAGFGSAVVLAYEPRWNVITMMQAGASPLAYLFDLNAGGFHAMTFGSMNYPTSATNSINNVGGADDYQSAAGLDNRAILYAGENGITAFIPGGSETFTATLTSGPIRIGESPAHDGLLSRFEFYPGDDLPRLEGATAAIRLQTGVDGADAIRRVSHTSNAYRYDITMPSATLTDSAANAYRYFPQLRGNTLVFRLTVATGGNGVAPKFSMDGANLEVRPAGRTRNMRVFSE